MFQGLIDQAKTAAGSLVSIYLARASVAVPFVVAAGFATAAVALLLTEEFGAIAAASIMAGGFTAIGALAAMLVTIKEQEDAAAAAEAQAENSNVASALDAMGDAVGQAVGQSPVELISALLLSTPLGPRLLSAGASSLGRPRSLALVATIAIVAVLLWADNLNSEDAEPQRADHAAGTGEATEAADAWNADRLRTEAA
ncbi:MAG TPA: hypothetical protein VNK52_16780 [Hyphomicrobiaceae bacterium]|nr:hypothetical protein [Hyphomicrobiaceae bacterium]